MSFEDYNRDGWTIIKNVLGREDLEYLKVFTLEVKNRVLANPDFEKLNKPNGSGSWWRGLDMASKSPLNTPEENERLFGFYTSKLMFDIASEYLGTDEVYLLNDQVVVKMPNEEFIFKPHRDGVLFENGQDVSTEYQSVNVLLALDDYTDENGGLEVQSNGSTELERVYPKEGDAILLDSNTLHASGKNESDNPRRAYSCTYATAPVGKDFRSGWWHERFIRNG